MGEAGLGGRRPLLDPLHSNAMQDDEGIEDRSRWKDVDLLMTRGGALAGPGFEASDELLDFLVIQVVEEVLLFLLVQLVAHILLHRSPSPIVVDAGAEDVDRGGHVAVRFLVEQ